MPFKQNDLFETRWIYKSISRRMLDQMLPYSKSGGFSMSRDEFEALTSGKHSRVAFVNHPDYGYILLIALSTGEYRTHYLHGRTRDALLEGVPQVYLRR